MTKIPFDIKYRSQIESGKYEVETGDKKRVRIICWNRKVNDFPIVALAYDAQKDVEIFINTSVLGEPHTNIASDRLFIVTPEEEFTEWEKAVGLALTDYQLLPRDKDGMINIHDFKEFIKERADKLLSIARKQAEKDLTLTWEDMAKIDAIIMDVNNEFAIDISKEISRQKFYEAVLKRFNELKK